MAISTSTKNIVFTRGSEPAVVVVAKGNTSPKAKVTFLEMSRQGVHVKTLPSIQFNKEFKESRLTPPDRVARLMAHFAFDLGITKEAHKELIKLVGLSKAEQSLLKWLD